MLDFRLINQKVHYTDIDAVQDEFEYAIENFENTMQLNLDCDHLISSRYVESTVLSLNKIIFRARHIINDARFYDYNIFDSPGRCASCIMHAANEFLIGFPFYNNALVLKYNTNPIKKEDNYNSKSNPKRIMTSKDISIYDFTRLFRSLCKEITSNYLITDVNLIILPLSRNPTKKKELLKLHKKLIKFTNTLSSLALRHDTCNRLDLCENTESLVFDLTMIILRIKREKAYLESLDCYMIRGFRNLFRKICNLSSTSLNLILSDIDNCDFICNGKQLSNDTKTKDELYPDKYENYRSFIGDFFNTVFNFSKNIRNSYTRFCYRMGIFNERWDTYDYNDIINEINDLDVNEVWNIEDNAYHKQVENAEETMKPENIGNVVDDKKFKNVENDPSKQEF